MNTTTIEQIDNIIQNLDFEGRDRLRLKVDKMVYQFTPSENGEYKELLDGLSNVIYSEFYAYQETTDLPKASYEARVEFIEKLREANAAEDGLHRGWKVDSVSPDGKVYATKGNYRRSVNPGDYIRSSMGEAVTAGSEIGIYQYAEYNNPDEAFFYIFGGPILETEAPGLVRFYFNAKPAGGIELVKQISTHFNRYQIPFQFKCLNQPALYNRTDSAVLYVSKNYSDFVLEIIASFYSKIKNLLEPEVPYFTKALAPGIGFAENPITEKESFGQSRSKIIAEAIVHAHIQKMPKTSWRTAILENLKKNGLDPDQLHLNPNSHYPYHFVSLA